MILTTFAQGAIHLTLDATSIFAPDERVRRFGRPRAQPSGSFLQRLTIPPITSALVKHSWDVSCDDEVSYQTRETRELPNTTR